MYEKPTSTILGPNLSCDWPAATSVYVLPFKAISLMSTIVVTDGPLALLNKVSLLIFIWDRNLCTEVWKDNCSCNWYLSVSVGKLFRTVTLNKLSDSFGCCCYLRTSLLSSPPTHSFRVCATVFGISLKWERTSRCACAVFLRSHLPKVDAFKWQYYYQSVQKITASHSVKCLLKRRASSW